MPQSNPPDSTNNTTGRNAPHPVSPTSSSSTDLDWSEVAAILDVVLDAPPGERDAMLSGLCSGNDMLRAEVEAMLQEEADAKALFTGGVAGLATSWDDLADAVSSWDDDLAGTRIGPYDIGEQIGHGGMGRVYRAHRADGSFEQRVAVKVIRRGLEPEAMQRFLAERRFLAQLQHPGIARLLNGGVMPDGRPYLIMEYVDGLPITEYAETRGLSLDARLSLMAQVCDAVQYAHTRLVVHRDLKPSNILVVSPGDDTLGEPIAKLLDFGIAKALSDSLSQDAVHTQTGQFVVTPAYAAPEQMTGGDLTTGTDVYALGLLLHELVAGTRPREHASREDLVRAAQLETPPPSITDTLSDGTRLIDRAQALDLSPGQLRSMAQTDLGTVIGTAMQIDPAVRYNTAGDLAGDLRRLLEQRPITARPPTLRYRARKFVARNPSVVASTSLAVVALIAGLILSLWQANIAAAERDRAQQEAEKSEQMAGFMSDLFRSNDPAVTLGDSITVGEILDRGRNRVLTDMDGQPDVQQAMAAEIASIYISMGQGAAAESLLTETRRRAETPIPQTPEMAQVLYLLGDVRDLAGDVDEALDYHQQAYEMRVALHGPVNYTVGQSLNQLANMHTYSGNHSVADSLYERALTVLAATADSTDDAYTSTVHNYAWMTRRHGDLARADSLYLRAYTLARANLPERHPDILTTLNGLALVRKTLGNHASADTLYRTILRQQTGVLGPGHPSVGVTHSNLGMLLKAMGRPDEAANHVQSALSIWETALGARHPYVAVGASNLGMIEADRGNVSDAEQHLRRALSIHRAVLPDDHPRLASTLVGLGRVLSSGDDPSADDLKAASALIEEGHAIRRRTHRADHPSIGESHLALADLANARGDTADANRHLSTAWDTVCANGTRPDPPPICDTINNRIGN